MKRIIAILLSAVLLLTLTGCGEKPQPVPELLYPTETANAVCTVKKSYLTSVQCTGGYVVPECVDMKFPYDTSAFKISVVLGDHVTEGQLLMELNPELEETIKRMEIAIVREQTEYDYDVEQFNKQVKQMRDYAKALGSSYDGKMMRLQVQEMQLNFDRNHSELSKKIEKDREELAELKQEFADSKVYAPCSGVVVYCNVYDDGDIIQEDKTFLTIAKDDTRQLACNFVSRADYDSFTDVKAYIGEDVYDVTYIPYTDEELYNLERTGNTYDSYFKADLKDSAKVGDYVQFVFTRTTPEPVMTVPNAAIVKSGNTSYVRIVRDGYMEDREVEVGDVGINDSEIVYGLAEGDVVYVAKDLARFGTKYETMKAERVVYSESISVTGARKTARVAEPFENPVPGEITEIHLTGLLNIAVKKGDPIFTVKANVGRADQEQAKLDLLKYTNDYEEKRSELVKQKDELKKEMKKMKSSSLEHALAELDLADIEEKIATLDEEAEEELEKLNERISNFTEWDGQTVVITAEKDCVISDISRFKVGSDIAEGEMLFEVYDLDTFNICIEQPAKGTKLRYGQKVLLRTTANGEEKEFDAYIVSASNVRPTDCDNKDSVYIALDDPSQYGEAGIVGVVYYEDYGVINSMVIDEKLVYHDPKKQSEKKEQTTRPNQQGNWGDWGGGWGQQEPVAEYEEAESFTFDSEEHEENKGKAYIWVYDANGVVVKRYIRVMRATDGRYWVVDGVADDDTILVH